MLLVSTPQNLHTSLSDAQVSEIVDTVMRHISMRPSLAEVTAEVQEWQAQRQPALMGIARHLADSVLKVECGLGECGEKQREGEWE